MGHDLHGLFACPRQQGAVLPRRGDERAGFAFNDGDVVVKNVLVFAWAGCFVQLPQHEAFKGLRLNFHGAGAQL